MGLAIAEVIPIAIGMVLANPIPIVAVILALFSPRARVIAPAFVAGWVLGIVIIFGIVLFGVSLENIVGDDREPSRLSSVGRLLAGIGLLILAFRQWRSRPTVDEEPTPPSWMVNLENASPLAAMGIGMALSGLNPMDIVFTVAAAVTVAQAELPAAQSLVPLAVYTAVASAGVAAPVIWYFTAQERAAKTLAGWRVWLTLNYATIITIVLFIFAIVLSMRGLGELVR